VKTLRIVEMPEDATREAALRAGEVDIAFIPVKILKRVVDGTGGTAIAVGMPSPNTIYMSGNYWGQTCATCPETDVYRKWPGFLEAIEKGYPWVGDPDDADQMEQARKVRWAMSMAIDRQQIIDTVLGGYGDPVYGALHLQFPPGTPNFQDEWFVPYDPAGAKAMLTEAGYPDGFDVTFWSAPDYPFWEPEVADAVAEMWRENLGLDVSVDHSPYAARRPESVDKTMNVPWLHGWGVPPGGAKANFYCAHPGHLGGVTMPDDVCAVALENDVEPDLQKRIQNNVEFQSYMAHWQVQIGVATVGKYFVQLDRVKDWKPYYEVSYFNNAETIVVE
jgi:ABC-type transport system substrate-binding protein